MDFDIPTSQISETYGSNEGQPKYKSEEIFKSFSAERKTRLSFFYPFIVLLFPLFKLLKQKSLLVTRCFVKYDRNVNKLKNVMDVWRNTDFGTSSVLFIFSFRPIKQQKLT